MRGSVFKRRGAPTWTIKYDLPRDPMTDRRRCKMQAGFRTRNDAQRALNEVIGKLNKGTYVENMGRTFGEWLREWLSAAKVDLRASTIPGYENAVESHLVPKLGDVPLQKLTGQQLTAIYAELLKDGHQQREGGLSPRTVRFIHTVARRALQDAVDARLIEWNPASGAKPPKTKTAQEAARRARRFWSGDEVRCFLDSICDHRLQGALHLAATTGMRRGEVLGLRWCDLDLDEARLTVEQTLLAPRYVLTFSEPKTGHGRRSIDLDSETVAVLRAHRKRQAAEQLAFGPDYAESELVFRTETGSPVTPHLFTLAFKKAVKTAKLPPIRLHDLRHSHVALLAKAGVPAKVIQERLGHHSAGFTLDNYGGTFPSQHREAAERFAQTLGGTALALGAPFLTEE